MARLRARAACADAGGLSVPAARDGHGTAIPSIRGKHLDPTSVMNESVLLVNIAKSLVLPPGGPLLAALLGLALQARCPKSGRTLVLVGLCTLLALSTPVTAGWLSRTYSAPARFEPAMAASAGAVVVLGGGKRNAPEFGGEAPNSLTLERLRYAARIARQTGLPILVSGGRVRGAQAEATLMRDVLVNDFGVEPRWVEAGSLNTHENALNASKMLAAAGIRTVVLVGHAFDVPRASAEFRAAGIEPIPAPIGLPRPSGALEPNDLLPSISALNESYFTIYEALGYLVLRLSRGGG
jgi:uncharacterized SAM-binding protein YcdF (DUF218 family)